jgi:hypothetical protein
MFKIGEIKTWAKKHGLTIKKQDDGYVWAEEGKEPNKSKSLEDAIKDMFNKITNNKFLKHQKNYTRPIDTTVQT